MSAFMTPVAEHLTMYHVETDNGVSYVPEDACGSLMCLPGGWVAEDELPSLAQYVDGEVQTAERREGWYSRLSASGYLDCTDWQGPYATAQEALDAVCDMYDVDAEGEEVES